MSQFRWAIGLAVVITAIGTRIEGKPFTPGNILVTHQAYLYEYTIEGEEIQAILVPHPDVEHWTVGDAVYDWRGRIHVWNESVQTSYISTYNAMTESWIHTYDPTVSGGATHHRDLSVDRVYLWSPGRQYRLDDFSIVDATLAEGAVQEYVCGLDGKLYATKFGSAPNGLVWEVDRMTIKVIRSMILRFENGNEITIHGMTVDTNGDLYVAAGRSVLHYSTQGELIRWKLVGNASTSLSNLELSPRGLLVAGTRGGVVLLIDKDSLDVVKPIIVGRFYPTFAGFVEAAAPWFRRGDANADGAVNLSDAVFTLNYLFTGGPPPACFDAADVNDDGGGTLDLSDPVYILNFLFLGGSKPPDPLERCGPDLTDDTLGCDGFLPCSEP